MSPSQHPFPPSVNWHLWRPCNMQCRHCFATFPESKVLVPRGHLGRDACLRVGAVLAEVFDKITFVGGEPTLCPWLHELIRQQGQADLTTMLVTNGTHLDPDRLRALAGHLHWLCLSVDSTLEATHVAMGRAVRGRALPTEHYIALAKVARSCGIRLKLNTVVTTSNAHEDMRGFVRAVAPERWKIFQVLPIAGENEAEFPALEVSPSQFASFVNRHSEDLPAGTVIVPEDNDAMTASYAMIDPAGRFFDNVDGRHNYGAPIPEVGLDGAWSSVRFDPRRFLSRGGSYPWR